MDKPVTLLQLNQYIASLLTVPATQNVWVVAELSDVNARGGHCYMELLQKDEAGRQVAKARAVIWANNFRTIAYEFHNATGQQFATGLKVMVRASVSMHPVYGMSLVINGVNPEFSMGDLLRRRQESIERLRKLGVLNSNRELPLADFPNRIAIISAPTAAGYGDFMKQLYGNSSHLRFYTTLFPAVMQGEKAPASMIAALEAIAERADEFDCAVLIRGGGASSDLLAFEDYNLAETIANFPLPVIIGIGHERDVTLLDYIAHTRLKTPTAVAEFLVGNGEQRIADLQRIASAILQTVSDTIGGAKEQLSYFEGIMPIAPVNALKGQQNRLTRALMSLSGISAKRISPALERLKIQQEMLPQILNAAIERAGVRLDSREQLVKALSPQAVLSRGYSITRVDGRALRKASEAPAGTVVETILADGSIKSIVN